MRLGRLTALRKSDGGVSELVVGDIMGRLVARTMAKQVAKKAEEATAPFLQCALTTKAGCECVAHILQTITDLDSRATVVSIDGVGAHDLISRNAMMEGLLRMEQGDQILPFVQCFYEARQRICGRMKQGTCKTSHKEEGGRRPPHAALVCVGFAWGAQRSAGQVAGPCLHDDVSVTCAPERVLDVYKILEEEICAHTHIRMHHGKTQVWNRGSVIPPGIETLTRVAQLTRPGAVVSRGR